MTTKRVGRVRARRHLLLIVRVCCGASTRARRQALREDRVVLVHLGQPGTVVLALPPIHCRHMMLIQVQKIA